MIDIKNVRPGDAITLEHPDGTTLARRVLLNGPTVNAQLAVETMPRGTWVSIARLLDDGWSITDHKPAEPKVELPTEFGWYEAEEFPISEGYLPYRLNERGWQEGGCSDASDDEMRMGGRLTRLVPEGSEREQAFAEVVQWFERDGYFGIANEVREHFGVTP